MTTDIPICKDCLHFAPGKFEENRFIGGRCQFRCDDIDPVSGELRHPLCSMERTSSLQLACQRHGQNYEKASLL